MSVLLRLTGGLHTALWHDLQRPHAVAAERVAFAFGRQAQTPEGPIIVLTSFCPVDDQDYEDDPSVGARINAVAMNKALRRAVTLGAAAFHVHAHAHRGIPWFSRTDMRELPPVVSPFQDLVPTQPRGLLLLSDDDATGIGWFPGDTSPRGISEIAIVGVPMRLLRGIR